MVFDFSGNVLVYNFVKPSNTLVLASSKPTHMGIIRKCHTTNNQLIFIDLNGSVASIKLDLIN